MIHVVFQYNDIETIQKAIELDASLNGEVIQIKDEFAVGPLGNIYEAEGYQARRGWWKEVLEFSPYTEQLDIADDKLSVHNIIKKLDENADEVLWIWVAQNQHDVCGYYWLMSQLKSYQGRVFILFLNNLPFINDKGGIFYPSNLFEILPKEIIKAKRLNRAVTLSEFEIDPDEWKRICNENGGVRLLEGGKKIVSRPVNYYDKDILQAVTAEPQKLSKVFATMFGKMKLRSGDAFSAWRMREMAKEGTLQVHGEWSKGWKEIVLQLPGTPATVSETGETA
ncbi:MAG TPA: DUF1835 domain-containing protein [Chitinophagaceae bacterium]|jgi:hypothetical protein|nr:DUF1835 domain-containing protein [Chitinophagaceae bacterium]